MSVRTLFFAFAFGLFYVSACSSTRDVLRDANEEITASRQATAQIEPIGTGDVQGTVRFQQRGEYVRISGTIRGLSRGKHGFHVHTGTSCSNRGGHFNPTGAPHGSPDEPERHVGDLGNLVADEGGTAEYQRVDRVISLSGSRSILGHALVVHQGEDNYISQPSGDSGTEIACGIIERQPSD